MNRSARSIRSPATRIGRDYRNLHNQLGITTVMITHDVLEAVLLADRIAVLQDGRLLEAGTPQEMMRSAQHPYVREIMDMPRRQAESLRNLSEGGRP